MLRLSMTWRLSQEAFLHGCPSCRKLFFSQALHICRVAPLSLSVLSAMSLTAAEACSMTRALPSLSLFPRKPPCAEHCVLAKNLAKPEGWQNPPRSVSSVSSVDVPRAMCPFTESLIPTNSALVTIFLLPSATIFAFLKNPSKYCAPSASVSLA